MVVACSEVAVDTKALAGQPAGVSARAPRISAPAVPQNTVPQAARPAMVRSASAKAIPARFENLPAPTVFTSEQTPQGTYAQPCTAFQLDMTSSQFGMCRCGFDRPAHNVARSPPDVEIAAAKQVTADASGPAQAGPSSALRIYSLQQLKERRQSGKFDGLDGKRLEDFLEEREFLKAFGVPPAEFTKLPTWKQQQLKKNAGIF